MKVVDTSQVEYEFVPQVGRSLMLEMRALRVGIIGLCNGNSACGTCHIYVEGECAADLPDMDEFESELISQLDNSRPQSRLACQIDYEPWMADLSVTVAER